MIERFQLALYRLGSVDRVAIDDEEDLFSIPVHKRVRNSQKVSAVALPSKIMKRNCPWALTADIMFSPKRAPVAVTTGVWPTSPQVVPRW